MKSSEIRIYMKVNVPWFSQRFIKWVDETGMFVFIICQLFLVACTRLYNPHWSVGRSCLTFFMILFLWPHCFCPNGLLTSNMAPAHLHATSVAVYPALLKPKPDHTFVWPYHIMVEYWKKHLPLNDVVHTDIIREGRVCILPNSAGKKLSKHVYVRLRHFWSLR